MEVCIWYASTAECELIPQQCPTASPYTYEIINAGINLH